MFLEYEYICMFMPKEHTTYKLTTEERKRVRNEARLYRQRANDKGFKTFTCRAPESLITELKKRYQEFKNKNKHLWVILPAGFELKKK